MVPRAAIGLPASLVFRLDQPQQGLVGLFARAVKTRMLVDLCKNTSH